MLLRLYTIDPYSISRKKEASRNVSSKLDGSEKLEKTYNYD